MDLTQSEVLVTMCIAYFHPHSYPRAHPCARGAANPPTNIWQQPEWALSRDDFFGLDRAGRRDPSVGTKSREGEGTSPVEAKGMMM
ncbi:hypothetical protein NKH36_30000 [Mesorhizobium sp. M1312]|uniref:hypothetical protein n=1 Tax=unclassified Mesorhizobium TaxID=325217 RepID=UPI003337B629